MFLIAEQNKDFQLDAACSVAPALVFLVLLMIGKPDATKSRIAALVIVFLVTVVFFIRARTLVPLMLFLPPLGLIWFSELLGNFVGSVPKGGYVNTTTPGWMIAGLGWIILLFFSGGILYECLFSKAGIN
jgi:hypothetical protein